jgi:hypothetical protein
MNLAGETKYSEETCPGATLSTTKSHMTRSRTPDRSGGKPAPNRLSYGEALTTIYFPSIHFTLLHFTTFLDDFPHTFTSPYLSLS